MRVAVPASVNVKLLLAPLNLSPTVFENHKNRLYYILSKIVIHNDNLELYKLKDFFRFVSSDKMKKVNGAKEYYFLLNEILLNKEDPIIESNKSYSNLKGKSFPKAFRLKKKYATGDVVFKQLNKKFADRVKRHTEDPEQ
jgi:hypothetical protein